MGLPKLAFPGGRAKTTTIYYPAPATTAGRPRPGPARWRRSALVAVAVAGLLLAGCGSSHPSSASPGPAFPSTPAGVQAQWLLQALARWPIPAAAIRAHFAPALLAKGSPAELNASLEEWQQLGLVSVTSKQPNSVEFVVSVRGGQRFRVDLTVDAHGLIDGAPSQEVAPTASSPASVIPALAPGWIAQPVTFEAGGVTIHGTYTHPGPDGASTPRIPGGPACGSGWGWRRSSSGHCSRPCRSTATTPPRSPPGSPRTHRCCSPAATPTARSATP